MSREHVEMVVETAEMIAHDTKLVRLKWPEGYDPQFRTGQFITLYWPETTDYKRAYSLSSCALDRGYFEVAVFREGKMGTRIVDWLRVGDKLWVVPPVGRFLPVFEPEVHLLCLAGGSGVTPFKGFAREATLRNLATRITVLYSARTPRDIIFQEDFRKLESANPRFRLLVTCTRVGPEDGWFGRRGRIDTGWIRKQIDDPAKTVCYACGSKEFVDFAERTITGELGIPKDRMRTEKWW